MKDLRAFTGELMKIDIVAATDADQAIIQNLGRFYVYDMSRYCGFLPGWETPSNGLYECVDLGHYWRESDRYPFLVKIDDEVSGFVLVYQTGSTPAIEWSMGEFFIVAKFQGKGIGRQVAEHIFNRFHGVWEVMQIPENTGAVEFWEHVIRSYTQDNFQKTEKTMTTPQPHSMVVLQFCSPQKHVSN